MKKFSRYILLIVALAFFTGLAPRFLMLDKAKELITGQLSAKLGIPIAVDKMEWDWLPLPHLSLSNTNIINDYSEISVPKMRIYPNWRVILNKQLLVGSIQLENPEIFINQKIFQEKKTAAPAIPELKVYIKNGILKIEADEDHKKILASDIFIFRDIDGTLKIGRQETKFDLHGSASFCESITLWGNLDPGTGKYQVFLDSQGIKMHEAITSLARGHIIPLESTAGLTGSLNGSGLQNFELKLHGMPPSVKVLHKDREILLVPGSTDFTMLKSGSLFRLNINRLEMQEPQAELSGLIERKSPGPADAMNLPESPGEPTWTLDLSGRDLDLSTIRQKVLTLWFDHHVADTVCNVVRGGKAASGAYRFSGRTSDFKHLAAMIVEADVLEADIHVPGAELDLKKAKGPIVIEQSVLSGKNLGAELENSLGSNGELFLELEGRNKGFTLDIDIDADLKDLPPVLDRLVAHAGFKKELHKFKGVSGRASGNLHLGDKLNHIVTRVNVRTMHFSTDYTPIPRTIYIDRGSLQVGQEIVGWQDVKGRIGRQEVMDTSGRVTWGQGEPLLQIETIKAQLDGETLYGLLEQTGKLPDKKVKGRVSALKGLIDVQNGTLKGPALHPESWEYNLKVGADKVSLVSPQLPEPASISEFSADIGSKEITIQQAGVNFLDQPIILVGNFSHRELEDWQGTVTFNAPLGEKLTNWLIAKEWLPEKVRPRLPCILEDLKLKFRKGKTEISGKIIRGTSGNKLPMVKIDIENTPENLHIREATFIAAGEQGSLKIDYSRMPPKKFTLSWQGFISADTLSSLFYHSIFRSGTLAGAFWGIDYSAGRTGQLRFKGLLKAENLLLQNSSDTGKTIIFENILLTGMGEQLRIAGLNLAIDSEKISGTGNISALDKRLQLDIDLFTSFVSKDSLDELFHELRDIKNIFRDDISGEKDGETVPDTWGITGRIGFNFESFTTSPEKKIFVKDGLPVQYTLYDTHGEVQLTPETRRTEISSSKLCGLEFKSSWYSGETSEQHYALTTGPDSPLYLENVLPCMGIEQDIIEGEFSLKANLRKNSGIWQSGNIHIKSSKGRILRLQLLSRVFRVLNITDLFVTEVGDKGKKGFPYSQMDFDTHIDTDKLIIDRAILHGEGLNLYLKGDVRLEDLDSDMTLLIAPFKTFDNLVSKVPLIGQPLMGEYESLVAIPVAIQGKLPDPQITPLHPKAVSGALFDFVKDTFKLPYNILKPNTP